MRPYVSVIIPAYNEEAFLPKCLNSLKKQKTSIPFEVIVVNNNSTDKTTTVAKRFNVHLIHEYKPGPAAARNKGASCAKGNILIFLDADCIPRSHHIQRIADWFTKHPHMHVLAGAYIYDSPAFIHWITTYGNFYTWYFALLKSIFGLQILIGGNFAIQKNVFTHIHGFNEKFTDLIHSEDAEFASRLRQLGYRVGFDPTIPILTTHRRLLTKFSLSEQLARTGSLWNHLLRYRFSSSTKLLVEDNL